jgi:membrane-associated phospholipid phosphatase
MKKAKPVNKGLFAFYTLVVVSIVGLTIFVQIFPISSFDLSITRSLQEPMTWDPTLLMRCISIIGDDLVAPFPVVIAALIFFLTSRRREALFTLAVVFPNLCNLLIKILIHRPRPTSDLVRVVSTYSESSFPSGHVVHYVVFLGFLLAVMIVDKSISLFWRYAVGILSSFFILTISISRIYLGAHWATDVIAGYLFGVVYLGIILRYYFRDPKFKQIGRAHV